MQTTMIDKVPVIKLVTKKQKVKRDFRSKLQLLSLLFCFTISSTQLLKSQDLNFRFIGTELDCDSKVMCFDLEAYANESSVLLDEVNIRFFIDDAQMTLISIHNPPSGYYLEFGNNSSTGVSGAGQSFFGFQGEFQYIKDNLKRIGAIGLEFGVGPQNYTYLMEACFQIVADVDLDALNSFCPTIVWDKEENGQSGFGTGSEGLQSLAIDPVDPDQSITLTEYVDHYNWDYFNPIEESCSAGANLVCIGDQEQTLNDDCEVVVDDYTALFSIIFDNTNSEITFANCGYDAGITITQSPLPGTIITELTTITVTGTDLLGNTEFCQFELDVIDDSINGFTITCPADQDISADANCEAMLPAYSSSVVVMDNCTEIGDIVITQSPEEGTHVSGTTVVTMTATDEAGNQVSCDFNVTVIDDSTNGFTITCPADQDISADANCEAALPDYSLLVVVLDNCSETGDMVITQSPEEGTLVTGTMVVTMTATDAAGNQLSCDFNVTVIDDLTNGFTITCPADEDLIADANCEAMLPDYSLMVVVMDNCSETGDIVITQSPEEGIHVSGTTVVTMTATDEAGNQVSCDFNVTVIDDSTNGFTITCPSDQTLNSIADCNVALPDYTNVDVIDNCTDPLSIDVVQDPAPGTLITAETMVTLTATDEAGNQVFCSFNVDFIGKVGLSVTCPEDQTVSANELCIGVIPDYTNDVMIDLACSNAPIVQTIQSPGINSLFIGTNTVYITVIDADGNSASCNFEVTLVDDTNTGLVIDCPEDQTISADEKCEAMLPTFIGNVDVFDNCSDPGDIVVTQNPPPGTIVTGDNTITMTAIDEAGNSTSCTFEFSVIDDNTNGFFLECSGNQDIDANENCEANILDYRDLIIVMDNCSDSMEIVISQSPSPGTLITQTTTVVITATDEAGNEVTCSFLVNIKDNEGLVLDCPLEQAVIANGDCEATVPDVLSLVNAEDNCSNEYELILSQSPVAGTIITAGTTVVVTALDAEGNVSTCSISIIIEYCEALVCGNLYEDVNGNGTQDSGEPDLPLVDVVVTDSHGNVQTVTTQSEPDGDLNGFWCAIVAPGDITVEIDETDPEFPAGTTQTEGDDPTIVTVFSSQVNNGGTDGFTILAEVCGHLYLDVNGNGTQDLGEPDLPNVDVEILDANNDIQIISSNADGDYCAFVPQGVVSIDIDENDPEYPTGSIQTEGDDPTLVVVNSGQIADGGNDGFSFYGELCGHLYNDLNGNGTQDPGEPGLPNVDVILTDANGMVHSAITIENVSNPSNSGDWCILIPPGDVTVYVDENDPDFLIGSTQTEGDNPTYVTSIVGQTIDAGNDGYQLLGNLCGHLYMDENGNGIQDNGEPNLPNVDVIIEDFSGNILTVSSNADGNYCANVSPGNAIVDVDESDPDFPTGATQTEGDDPTTVFVISAETSDAGNDGYSIYGELCGKVYHDVNGNGMQDSSEPDLPLIDVIITDANGTVYTVTTMLDPDGDLNGVWCVSVPPGVVEIDIDNTSSIFLDDATQTEGDDPTIVTVIAGQINNGGEDGFSIFGTVCGHLYLDVNGNGTQDGAEPDLANIDVIMTDANNNISTVTSDSNGNYCKVVPPGTVIVDVDETDADFPTNAIQTEGDDPSFVSSISGQTLDAGIDGYSIYGKVCGHLYTDTNGNGVQDAGEPDLTGVDVIVTDVNGTQHTVTTLVDADGDLNGVWCIELPPGLSSADVDETDIPLANPVHTDGDDPTFFEVIAGQTVDGGEDGYSVYGEVCGHVYFDANNNFIQDGGDLDLEAVQVNIMDANGKFHIVNTDINGDYCVAVPPGVAIVDVNELDDNIPSGSAQTEGDDPTIVFVSAGLISNAGNDGYTNIAEVCGHIYIDLDDNGIEDLTDLPFANLDVIIEDASGLIQTIVTDADGNYCALVSPGNVTISPDMNDSDFVTGSYLTEGVVPLNLSINVAETQNTDDLGYFVPAGVCGRVFYDINQNGLMDPGEQGIPNIDVVIADVSQNPISVETDADGYYCAVVLPGGVFINVLEEDVDFPIGAFHTNAGLDPNLVFANLGGYIDGGIDGYTTGSAICGVVYYDDNGNGIQDNSEAGISKLTIFITDSEANVHTIETGDDGSYCYNVVPGLTSITIDETDPDFPLNATQTEGDNPSIVNALADQVVATGNDGFQICLTINAKVFLEGALTDPFGDLEYTDLMRTELNNFRLLPGQTYNDPLFGLTYNPAGQPYNEEPWFYNGNEGDSFDSQGNPVFADATYEADVVDWVLVSLRTGLDKLTEICKAAAMVKSNGDIMFVEDFDCCGYSDESFYLVVEHRNHLIVMSPDPVERIAGEISFDFTQNESFTGFFGLAIGQKQVISNTGNNYYTMFAANGDQVNVGATDINVNDLVIWIAKNNEGAIYYKADFNLSGDVNVNDKVLHDINNSNFSEVPY